VFLISRLTRDLTRHLSTRHDLRHCPLLDIVDLGAQGLETALWGVGRAHGRIKPYLQKYLMTARLKWIWRPRMDWSKFDLAMTHARYLHGAPVFRDEPRMPVQAVLDHLDDGMTLDAIAKAYQIELRLVMAVRQFAERQRLAHSV
jgi:uncharacterized protein (DUF433 family)